MHAMNRREFLMKGGGACFLASAAGLPATANGMSRGLRTGVPGLDAVLGPLKPGAMTVMTARPATGKSAMALNIALHNAVDLGHHVTYFSLKTAREDLVRRLLACRAGVTRDAIRTGLFTRDGLSRLTEASREIEGASLVIDDTPSIPVEQICACVSAQPCRKESLVIVDFVQLIRLSRQYESRLAALASILESLNQLAQDHALHMLVLSSLSRDPGGSASTRYQDSSEWPVINGFAKHTIHLGNGPYLESRPLPRFCRRIQASVFSTCSYVQRQKPAHVKLLFDTDRQRVMET